MSLDDLPPARRLDFDAADQTDSVSASRAVEERAFISRRNRFRWRVVLGDGEVHTVQLAYDSSDAGYLGACDCKGYEFGDTEAEHGDPCAHLWALYNAVEDYDMEDLDHIHAALDGVPTCPTCGEPQEPNGGR